LIHGSRSIRAGLALAAIAAALLLAGCNAESIPTVPARAMTPLSKEMTTELERKQMPNESPILVRIFKEEAELEVWKKDTTGNFALLKTYPICRWSGDLGPKIKEGDRQAPEGFYQITPGQMNPNSNYYLAFNLGFPNTYDRANDRTGAFLMVHGDCSSRGCYAMTDEQIGEIFSLGRDSFQGGQKSFQVQAYPFRMTPANMAKHRTSPHMAFWRMIKQGYDHFEVTRQEPKVNVCEKHYVFDAEGANGATPSFNARNHCPAYQVSPAIASLVRDKQNNDERQYAELVSRNIAITPSRGDVDGGMHPTFAARLKPKNLLDGIFADNKPIVGAQPGPMGNNVNPPKNVDSIVASAGNEMVPVSTPVAAYSAPAPAAQPAPVRVASPAPVAPKAEPKVAEAKPAQPSKLQRLGNMIGLRGSRPAENAEAKPAEPKAAASQQQVAQASGNPGVINGAAAPVPSASFDSRFGR
jgi:murein L,D-transpeptidase YafK